MSIAANGVSILAAGAWTGEPQSSPLSMSREAFAAFHDATYRGLWGYVLRTTQSHSLADDITQESYLRLLKASIPDAIDFTGIKNYLYRIASNLWVDHLRRRRSAALPDEVADTRHFAKAVEARVDINRALSVLSPRTRALLWLAHVEGLSYREISFQLKVKETSVAPMLFRARRRIEEILT